MEYGDAKFIKGGQAVFFSWYRDSSIYPYLEQEMLQMFCLLEQRLSGLKLRKANECHHVVPGCCYRPPGQAEKVG